MASAKQGELLVSRDRGTTWEDAGISGESIAALVDAPGEPRKILALTSDGATYGCAY